MAGCAECQVSNTVAAVVLQSRWGGMVLGCRDGGGPGRRQAGLVHECHARHPQRTAAAHRANPSIRVLGAIFRVWSLCLFFFLAVAWIPEGELSAALWKPEDLTLLLPHLGNLGLLPCKAPSEEMVSK